MKGSFLNYYLPKAKGNPMVALQKLQNELCSKARTVLIDRYNRHNIAHCEQLHDLMQNRDFQTKHQFVDSKIESDIRFFSTNYNEKQAYIFDIKKIIQMNAKKLKFRFEMQDQFDKQLDMLKQKLKRNQSVNINRKSAEIQNRAKSAS